LTQALAELSQPQPPRLWVVMRDVQPDTGRPGASGLVQAPAWGLARTIAVEHPELACTCVDLGAATGREAGDLLRAEIEARPGEDQVAYRGGRRHVGGLVRRSGPAAAEAQPQELVIETRGILEELRLRPASRRQPGPGEVEIRVAAAAL